MSSPWNRTTIWAVLVSLFVLVIVGAGAEEPTSTTQHPNGTMTTSAAVTSSGSSVLTSLQPSQTLPMSSTTPGLDAPTKSSSNGTSATLPTNDSVSGSFVSANETMALASTSWLPSGVTSSSLVSPTDVMTTLNFHTSTLTALMPESTAALPAASSDAVVDPTATSSVNTSDSVNETEGLSASPGSDIFTFQPVASTAGTTYIVPTTVSIQPTPVSLTTTVPVFSTTMDMSSSDIPYQVSTASRAAGNSSDGPRGKPTTDASSSHVEEHKHSSLSVGAKAAIGVFVSLAVCGVIFGAIVCSRRSNMTARSVKSLITSGIRYKTYKNKDDEGMLIMPDRR